MSFKFSSKDLQSEIRFSAVRSRGPGGQNVNKVSSAAILNWNFLNSSNLNEEEKNLIQNKLSRHINKEGVFYLRCDEFRDLEKNKRRCLDKLEDALKKAFFKPKKRKKTHPTRASQKKRIESKSRRGKIKQLRAKVDRD